MKRHSTYEQGRQTYAFSKLEDVNEWGLETHQYDESPMARKGNIANWALLHQTLFEASFKLEVTHWVSAVRSKEKIADKMKVVRKL